MTNADMMQICLDLSNASMTLFDLVEEDGIDAPMTDYDNILKLKAVIETSEKISGFYMRRNIQRMLAIGVSTETLLKMTSDSDE